MYKYVHVYGARMYVYIYRESPRDFFQHVMHVATSCHVMHVATSCHVMHVATSCHVMHVATSCHVMHVATSCHVMHVATSCHVMHVATSCHVMHVATYQVVHTMHAGLELHRHDGRSNWSRSALNHS